MKKRFLCAAVTLVSLFLFACASSPIVWDASVPEDETATVYFYSLDPSAYNDVAVDWKVYATVKIPEGTAEFVVNASNYSRPITDGIFSYRFERGSEYTLAFNWVEAEGGRVIVGAGIYKGHNVVDKDQLLDFIPFSNKN